MPPASQFDPITPLVEQAHAVEVAAGEVRDRIEMGLLDPKDAQLAALHLGALREFGERLLELMPLSPEREPAEHVASPTHPELLDLAHRATRDVLGVLRVVEQDLLAPNQRDAAYVQLRAMRFCAGRVLKMTPKGPRAEQREAEPCASS